MKTKHAYRDAKLSAAIIWLSAVTTAHAQEPQQAPDDLNFETDTGLESPDTTEYITSLRNARNGLMIAGDFDAALSPAKLVISELESRGDREVAADRVVLATILAELGQFDDAEIEFLDVIASLGEEEGSFSTSLIRPMQLLGRTYIRNRRFPQAITVLTEARHISQRSSGLFNVDQSALIDDMTTAYLGTGDTAAAKELQVERLTNAQRRFGPGDPQVVPFHNTLASYYARSRLLSSARDQYEAALEIARTQSATEPLAVLEPLRSIARIDMLTGNRRAALDELAEIVDSRSDIEPFELGLTLAVLGDHAVVQEEPRDADALYARSFAAIEESGRADANELFANPEIIRFIPPITRVDRGDRSLPYSFGKIVLEFNVDAEGRISDITGFAASPEGLIEQAYVERLQQAYFRPQIVDGRPIAAEGVRLTHYFRYYVEEEDAAE